MVIAGRISDAAESSPWRAQGDSEDAQQDDPEEEAGDGLERGEHADEGGGSAAVLPEGNVVPHSDADQHAERKARAS
jgi:hypothetical protein